MPDPTPRPEEVRAQLERVLGSCELARWGLARLERACQLVECDRERRIGHPEAAQASGHGVVEACLPFVRRCPIEIDHAGPRVLPVEKAPGPREDRLVRKVANGVARASFRWPRC